MDVVKHAARNGAGFWTMSKVPKVPGLLVTLPGVNVNVEPQWSSAVLPPIGQMTYEV